MFRKLVRFVEEENLFYRDEKLLVAVSGGVDSVVLLHLLRKMEVDCGVAHCNFHLRGEESDADCEFVRNLAEENKIPFHGTDFDTRFYAASNKISIEMAARELRYQWFEQICETFGYQYIAVGHHVDDTIETLLINLTRGTGIRGLTGIKSKLGKTIRPLLSFTRKQLLEYANEHSLRFREDSTNAETDFIRNKIRHQVLPVLEQINPAIRNTMLENVERFKEVEEIYKHAIEQEQSGLLVHRNDYLMISIEKLKELKAPVSHLHEILSPYGFHYRDVKKIAESVHSISGKQFFSPTHQLLRDRDYLLLSVMEKTDEKEYLVTGNESELSIPINLEFSWIDRANDFKVPANLKLVCLDAERLQFPLKLRKWKKGDQFQPIGMRGRKKLSDFFIDQKFSLQDKQNTWLLLSGEEIVWVVGHRMDDRFKITENTSLVYQIKLS